MTDITSSSLHTPAPRHIAVVGAGMSGIACARTLLQAGHQVTVFESAPEAGGRMSSQSSPFGNFDAGAQYFTVRDARFERALETVQGLCRPWSATHLRVLDAEGKVAAVAPSSSEAHWVAQPSMQTLVTTWAQPLEQAGRVRTHTPITQLRYHPQAAKPWELVTTPDAPQPAEATTFDAVVLALPAPDVQALLQRSQLSSCISPALESVVMAPCWTVMLAFPQAMQPGLTTLGPQWNAARSTHHRISWLARESSKPGRGQIERWTVQAHPQWSAEHFHDSPQRVQAKLERAFADVTGIHAQPSWSAIHRWEWAQTTQALGRNYLWDANLSLGACGDWCLGHRVENAFISGLELALHLA